MQVGCAAALNGLVQSARILSGHGEAILSTAVDFCVPLDVCFTTCFF